MLSPLAIARLSCLRQRVTAMAVDSRVAAVAAVAWYADKVIVGRVPCPAAVAAVVRGYIAGGRDGKWYWEDMAENVLASATYGIGKDHAALKLAVINSGAMLRTAYQPKGQWLAAFGAGSPVVSDSTCDSIYHLIRRTAWQAINTPSDMLLQVPAETKAANGKREPHKVPQL